MGTEIIICIALVAGSIIAVAVAADRAGSRAAAERETERRLETEAQVRRFEAETHRETVAASFYLSRMSLEVAARMAEHQGKTSAAIAQVAGMMQANDRAAIEALGTTKAALHEAVKAGRALNREDREALEKLEARATVNAYTQMLLEDKKRSGQGQPKAAARPWVR